MRPRELKEFPNLKEYLQFVLDEIDDEITNNKRREAVIDTIVAEIQRQQQNLLQLSPKNINSVQDMMNCADTLKTYLNTFGKIASSVVISDNALAATVTKAIDTLPTDFKIPRHAIMIKLQAVVKACIQIYDEIMRKFKEVTPKSLFGSIKDNLTEFKKFVTKEEQSAPVKEFMLRDNKVLQKFRALLIEVPTGPHGPYSQADNIKFNKNIVEATKLVPTLNQVASAQIEKMKQETSITATRRDWMAELSNAKSKEDSDKIWNDYFSEFWGNATDKVKSFGKNFLKCLFDYGFDAKTNNFNYFLKKLYLAYPQHFNMITEDKFTAIYEFFTTVSNPAALRTIVDNKERTSILWCLDLYNQPYAKFYNFLVLEENIKRYYLKHKFAQNFIGLYDKNIHIQMNYWNNLILTTKGIVSLDIDNLDKSSILDVSPSWNNTKLISLALAKQNFATVFGESGQTNALGIASDIVKRILFDDLNVIDTKQPVPLATRQKGIDLLLYIMTIYDTQHGCQEIQKYFTDLDNKLNTKTYTAKELTDMSDRISKLNIEITPKNIKDVVLELSLALQLPKTQLGEKHLTK